jgi:hypothetical protein
LATGLGEKKSGTTGSCLKQVKIYLLRNVIRQTAVGTTIKKRNKPNLSQMETKKYTQFGTFSVIIMLPLLLLFTGLLIKSGLTNSPDFYVHIFLVLTFLVCLLIFYKLTIIVDRTSVSFRLGIGLISKSYKISDIKFCRPVSNSVISGIGIRMLPNGWLYNVSGLKAIELQFINKKSVIRIGTNRPDEISQLVQSLIAGEQASNEMTEISTKKWINPLWILTIVLIPALVLIPNYQETKVRFDEKGFKIKGVYGMVIPYSDIEQIDTIPNIPGISLRTNGYAFGKTLIGNFKLADDSHSKLFIKKGFAPYILIKSKGRVPVYINFENKQKTIDLYNELKNKK